MKISALRFSNLVTFAVAILFVTTSKADWGPGRCEDAKMQLNNAQVGLAHATAILGQVNNICGSQIACIITAQTAYNNAVAAVNNATQYKEFACGCQDAIAQVNNAQAAFNQAWAILLNVNNICGGQIACIVTAQNAFNQAQQGLNNAQAEKSRLCRGGRPGRGHGGGHGGGGWGRRGGGPGFGPDGNFSADGQ